MGEEDGLAALVRDLGDGRDDPLDAGGIGDLAVLDRHIEIDAQQHAFVLEVGVIEGSEIGHVLSLVSRASEARPGTQLA